MKVKTYEKQYANDLFDMIKKEGSDWSDYYDNKEKYIKVLESSIVYLAFKKEKLCGYIRCHNDFGFGIYVYDLLVDKDFRGKSYGKKLISRTKLDFPNDTIYVMSDADDYYKKQGYKREGSIFVVSR